MLQSNLIKNNLLNNIEIQIEDSILVRLSIYLVCLYTILSYGFLMYIELNEVEFLISSFIYLFFITIGYIWSYIYRNSKQYFVKFLLALLMIIFMINFFKDLSLNLYDPRIPLVNLLITLLVIHSYDLPRKRDLFYSLLSAIIVFIALSVIITNPIFILFILGITILVFISINSINLNIKYISEFLSNFNINTILGFIFFLISLLFYFVLPKPQAGYYFKTVLAPKNFQEVNNKNLFEKKQDSQKLNNQILNKEYSYKAFKGEVDLNNRGLLPHILLMKVKSPLLTYIKGVHYSYYDGKKWKYSENKDLFISSYENSIFDVETYNDIYLTDSYDEITIYFIIQQDMPDILYHIPIPYQFYIPTQNILTKDYNFFSDYPLVKGMTYTVISKIPRIDYNILNNLTTKDYQDFINHIYSKNKKELYKNLQLPEKLPNEIKELAMNLTKNEPYFIKKVEKIKEYLEKNYKYNLFIKELEAEDAVYDFLFIKKEGYCEQFASAMSVMLRSIGIPARLVVGYAPDKKDILTGFINVYADDAHAWVEVLTPYGWLPFDPSPTNIDINTLNYLKTSKIFGIKNFGFDNQDLQNISIILKIFINIFIFGIISYLLFLSFKVYNFMQLKNFIKDFIYKYSLNDIEKLNKKDLLKSFSSFFKYLNTIIPYENNLTLREYISKIKGSKNSLQNFEQDFDKIISFFEILTINYERIIYKKQN
ncbi:MAG: transglutaminase-like domain-containing protein [bacterium]